MDRTSPKNERNKATLVGEPRKPIRVKDLAEITGLSVATVSRTFSKPEAVRPKLRQMVLKAAEEFGYYPNPSAQALRLRRTRMIGVLLPTLNYSLYAGMIDGIEGVLTEAGYFVIINSTGFDERKVVERARAMADRGAEAIICAGPLSDRDLSSLLKSRSIPLITTYNYEPEALFASVGFDNVEAASQVAKHLRLLGHRNLAVLLGPTEYHTLHAGLLEGFRKGFESDSEHRILYVSETDYTIACGEEEIDAIIRDYPAVTAVATASDVLAIGVVLRCSKLGIPVPERYSVTGFDDIDLASHSMKPLTTSRIPAAQMGEEAARSLVDYLENGRPIGHVRLETRLVIRTTTGPAYANCE
jgi:LacI family transcriptional regulator